MPVLHLNTCKTKRLLRNGDVIHLRPNRVVCRLNRIRWALSEFLGVILYNLSSVIAKIISSMPDKMSGRPSALCRTFWAHVRHFSQLMTGQYQWWSLPLLSDILCVLQHAGQNVQQGMSSLPDISRSLPDRSGIFRDHWSLMPNNKVLQQKILGCILSNSFTIFTHVVLLGQKSIYRSW